MANASYPVQNINHRSTGNEVFKKERKQLSTKKNNAKKELLYKIIHPDYILFDWEYFSRELEFE